MLEIPTKYGWKTIEEKRPIIEVQNEMGGLKLKLEINKTLKSSIIKSKQNAI